MKPNLEANADKDADGDDGDDGDFEASRRGRRGVLARSSAHRVDCGGGTVVSVATIRSRTSADQVEARCIVQIQAMEQSWSRE